MAASKLTDKQQRVMERVTRRPGWRPHPGDFRARFTLKKMVERGLVKYDAGRGGYVRADVEPVRQQAFSWHPEPGMVGPRSGGAGQ